MSEIPTTVPAVETLAKTAATFRLTPKAHRLIALAVNDARAQGRQATKGEMVEQAVRAAYGKLDSSKV